MTRDQIPWLRNTWGVAVLLLLAAVVGLLGWWVLDSSDVAQTGDVSAECREALADAHRAGLVLPESYDFRCPGNTDAGDGRDPAAGVTCGFADGCPDGAGPYVAVAPDVVAANGLGLDCVVGHEVAHALELVERGSTSERSATARAEAVGFAPACQGQP